MNLTARQVTVLKLLADGASVEDMAHVLYLSEETIRTHRKALYRRMRVSNAAHAVATGFRLGILRADIIEYAFDRGSYGQAR